MRCQSDTSGYCERSESGSQVHQLAQGDTLEDSGWHFRVFFLRVILALLSREAMDWSWLRMRMQTTPAINWFPVGLSCAQEHACAGFRGLKSA